jgi:hypothetical protein
MNGSQERWMELRAFKALADAGATWAEIARETGTTGAPSSATSRPILFGCQAFPMSRLCAGLAWGRPSAQVGRSWLRSRSALGVGR